VETLGGSENATKQKLRACLPRKYAADML